MEPQPENISGEVVRRHSFEHRINWGHVALGIAALYVAIQVSRVLKSNESDAVSASWEDAESSEHQIA